MTKYTVLGSYDVRFTIEADSADEAAEIVQQGDAGNGEIEGASIDKVTSKYKAGWFWNDYEDERSYCTCGHLMDQHFPGGAVTADDGTSVPVAPCHYRCGCLTPKLRRAAHVELPAEDVAS